MLPCPLCAVKGQEDCKKPLSDWCEAGKTLVNEACGSQLKEHVDYITCKLQTRNREYIYSDDPNERFPGELGRYLCDLREHGVNWSVKVLSTETVEQNHNDL